MQREFPSGGATGLRCGDGELACRRGSVCPVPLRSPGGWPSICAVYLGTSTGPVVPRLTLLRVGVAEPPGSPPTLVRSYRTLSPLPVPEGHRRSALCCPEPTGHPVLALTSTLPYGAPTFLDVVKPRRGHQASSPSPSVSHVGAVEAPLPCIQSDGNQPKDVIMMA